MKSEPPVVAMVAAAIHNLSFIYPPNIAAQLSLPLSLVQIVLHGLSHSGAIEKHSSAHGTYCSKSAG